MPGYGAWGKDLEALLGRTEAIWVHGGTGSGVSLVGAELARRRCTIFLDDADAMDAEALQAWMAQHPGGVLGSHRPLVPLLNALELRLWALDEDPKSASVCLGILAEEEKIGEKLPAGLAQLPCPGELRGLRNRLLRWKYLGQLPEASGTQEVALPLDLDDYATNLHILERLLLHRALRRSYGNRVEAARRLGVSRRQLYLLIARHGDPVRGEIATSDGPKRLGKARIRQNSSQESTPR